jgi:hypothetical protein
MQHHKKLTIESRRRRAGSSFVRNEVIGIYIAKSDMRKPTITDIE